MGFRPQEHIIVIGRQFGSGGREAGRLLAERLGIPFYDHRLILETSERYGYNKKLLDNADERRPSFLRSLIGMTYASPNYHGTALDSERLYMAQSNAIREIIGRGPCVLMGRTADYIARDCENLVSVFIHSDLPSRQRRIMERDAGLTADEARQKAQKADKYREEYYNYFTGRHWGHASNYDLSIDASRLEVGEIVDLIMAYLSIRSGSKPNNYSND